MRYPYEHDAYQGSRTKGKRTYGRVPRNRGKNTTLIASMSLSGMAQAMTFDGATDKELFEAYVERFLAPGLRPGQVVDVALYEAVFNLMESMVPEYSVAGIVRERTGASLPGITPSNFYCTGSGPYVAVDANSDAIFKRLMKAIGHPELAEDPRYESNADRTDDAEELDDLVEEWTRRHTLDEVLRILGEASAKRRSRRDQSTRSPTSCRIRSIEPAR